jgi:hypothetical protein
MNMEKEEIKKNEKTVLSSITSILEDFNYDKKLRTWWQNKNDIVILINFQKSSWGADYYINFGLFFHNLKIDGKLPPKDYEWHLWARYNDLVRISEKRERKILKLDISTEELDKRIKIICKNISEKILPVLNTISDYGYLVNKLKDKGEFKGFIVKNILTKDLIVFIHNESIRLNL